MNKTIIILFLLLNCTMRAFSQNYLISGEISVKAGESYIYTPTYSGATWGAPVTWTVSNGKFFSANGSKTFTDYVGTGTVISVVWDNIRGKGSLSFSVGSIRGFMNNVSIYSVKDAVITDVYYNGNRLSSDIIEIPKDEEGSFVCKLGQVMYPNAPYYGDFEIYSFKWVLPKSFGGQTITKGNEMVIDYDRNVGDGEKITITPVGYNNYLGRTKTISIKRTGSPTPPPPPPFDGNIKNVTITSNKTYKHSNIYVENVTIKSGANVVMNGYNSVRIVPGFTAELGSTIRIYNGTVSNAQTRTIVNEEEGGIKESIEVDKNIAKLYQNYPSPAYSMTTIPCVIPEKTRSAYIQVYNLMGILVLKIPITSIGQNSIDVNTTELTNGVYMYSLIVEDCLIDTKRMVAAN